MEPNTVNTEALTIRAELRDVLPKLDKAEYTALKRSIEDHGITDPVKINDANAILDGHHRYIIAQELGIAVPTTIIDTGDEVAYALSCNFARRNLTTEQKQEAVRRLNESGMSQRAIATATGVPKSTVARWVKPVAPNGAPWVTASMEELEAHVERLNTERENRDVPVKWGAHSAAHLADFIIWSRELGERKMWQVGQIIVEGHDGKAPSREEATGIADYLELKGTEIDSPELVMMLAQIALIHPLDALGRRPRGLHLWELAIGASSYMREQLGECRQGINE